MDKEVVEGMVEQDKEEKDVLLEEFIAATEEDMKPEEKQPEENSNNKGKGKLAKELKDWAIALVIAVAVSAVVLYCIWPMKVQQQSMLTTLRPGQFMLVSHLAYDIGSPEYMDIAIMKVDWGEGKKRVVKRVIALEGDHIIVKDGKVYVARANSDKGLEELDQSYTKDNYTTGNVDLIVPEGHIFVMGDNRKVSNDSRDPNFGCVPLEDVKAKVLFVD